MTIKFYNVISEKKKINKTLGSVLITKDGVLLPGSSLNNPTVRVELTAARLKQVNYAYIESLGRYYYITNVEFVGSSIWNVTFTVDVLMSFKTNIESSEAYVRRTSNASHIKTDVTDNRFLTTAIPTVYERTGTLTSDDDWRPSNRAFRLVGSQDSHEHYVIAFRANGGETLGGSAVKPYTGTYYLECLLEEMESIWASLSGTIVDMTKYIIDVYWLPFELHHSSTDQDVRKLYFGDVQTGTGGVSGAFTFGTTLDLGISPFLMNVVEHNTYFRINLPTSSAGYDPTEFYGHSPYTKMSLRFMPFGTFDLDTGFLAGETSVNVLVRTNKISGTAALYYYKGSISTAPDDNDLRLLSTSNVKISVPVSAESGSGLLKIATNAFAGLRAGAAMGAAAGPYGAIAGGIAGAASSVAMDSMTFANNAPISTSGSVNIIEAAPVLQITQYKPDVSADLVGIHGRVCDDVMQLNTFAAGDYVECGEVHLDSSGMLDAERDQTEQWLHGGVYI